MPENSDSPREVTERLLELSEPTFTAREHQMHHQVIDELRAELADALAKIEAYEEEYRRWQRQAEAPTVYSE
jgi:hypothetical protein